MKKLEHFRGLHAGEVALVLGLGESLNLLREVPSGVTLIGVNDIARTGIYPDYLAMMDNPREMAAGHRLAGVFDAVRAPRLKRIFCGNAHAWAEAFVPKNSKALGMKTIPDNCYPAQKLVHMPSLRNDAGVPELEPVQFAFDRGHVVAKMSSPFTAVSLAAFLGFTDIGVLGVDHTPGHAWSVGNPDEKIPMVYIDGETGKENFQHLNTLNESYGILNSQLAAMGHRVFNLSPTSRITTLPTCSIDDFFNQTLATNEELPTAPSDPGPTPPARLQRDQVRGGDSPEDRASHRHGQDADQQSDSDHPAGANVPGGDREEDGRGESPDQSR